MNAPADMVDARWAATREADDTLADDYWDAVEEATRHAEDAHQAAYDAACERADV